MLSVVNDQWEIAEYLKAAGASPHHATSIGRTVLLESIREDKAAFIDWALENGVEVNTMEEKRRHGVPLILAAYKDDAVLVKRLLEAGADPMAENFLGKTAADYAEDDEILQMLAIPEAPVDP